MDAGHSHRQVCSGHEKTLYMALALTSVFLLVELVGAYLTRSLALLSDAAHMFTDAVALAVSLAAIALDKRAADKKRTFGYYHFEMLAAALNASLLFLVAMYILYKACQRVQADHHVVGGCRHVCGGAGTVGAGGNGGNVKPEY